MRQVFQAFLVLFTLTLAQCDRDRGTTVNPAVEPEPSVAPQPGAKSKILLYLYAGGFCGPCKEELPEVQKWYDALPGEKRERISPLVVFVAGNPGSTPANQTDAEAFKKDLGLSFDIIADKYGKTYYKPYYPEGRDVPASVITAENKKALKTYPQGKKLPVQVLDADVNEILNKE